MLRKLLKYEWKSTARVFGLCYLALLVVAFLGGTLLPMRTETMMASIPLIILILLYAFLIGAIIILTIYMIIQRFYRNLLGQEGYLMHTLPVPMWKHIMSKLLVATCWFVCSLVSIVVSIFLLSWRVIPWSELSSAISLIWEIIKNPSLVPGLNFMVGSNIVGFFILLLLTVIVGFASNVLFFYASMAIGALANQHRKLCCFGAYVGLNIILEIITSILGTIVDAVNIIHFEINSIYSVNIVLGLSILGSIVLGAILFFITDRLLTKRLNLE